MISEPRESFAHVGQPNTRCGATSFDPSEPKCEFSSAVLETYFRGDVGRALKGLIGPTFGKKDLAAELKIGARALDDILEGDSEPSWPTARAMLFQLFKHGRWTVAARLLGLDFDAEVNRRALEMARGIFRQAIDAARPNFKLVK